MTKEHYLGIKIELKHRALAIASTKLHHKEEQRAGKTGSAAAILAKLLRDRAAYRVQHIFMSLLRGKTREEIERNPRTGVDEEAIMDLCEKYGIAFYTRRVPNVSKGVKHRVVAIKHTCKHSTRVDPSCPVSCCD